MSGNTNFNQTVEPDYVMTIGIKDGRVVSFLWGKSIGESVEQKIKHTNLIKKYFKQVIKMMDETSKEENK